jgi:probable rRNA maturation factor
MSPSQPTLPCENSIQLGHPVAQEVKILALHGILHLAGFDHERDNGEMARKEAIAPGAQTAGGADRTSSHTISPGKYVAETSPEPAARSRTRSNA